MAFGECDKAVISSFMPFCAYAPSKRVKSDLKIKNVITVTYLDASTPVPLILVFVKDVFLYITETRERRPRFSRKYTSNASRLFLGITFITEVFFDMIKNNYI